MTNIGRQTGSENLEVAFESIDSCFGYVDHICEQIKVTVSLYENNEPLSAQTHFIEVIELMDLYIQLVTRIYKTLRAETAYSSLKKDSIIKLEIHLLSVMKALLQAKEKNDVVVLCDLLEYELLDNLTQWKIKILPELKKLKNF